MHTFRKRISAYDKCKTASFRIWTWFAESISYVITKEYNNVCSLDKKKKKIQWKAAKTVKIF